MQNDLDIIVIAEDKASSILKKIQGSVDAV